MTFITNKRHKETYFLYEIQIEEKKKKIVLRDVYFLQEKDSLQFGFTLKEQRDAGKPQAKSD